MNSGIMGIEKYSFRCTSWFTHHAWKLRLFRQTPTNVLRTNFRLYYGFFGGKSVVLFFLVGFKTVTTNKRSKMRCEGNLSLLVVVLAKILNCLSFGVLKLSIFHTNFALFGSCNFCCNLLQKETPTYYFWDQRIE